MKLIALVSIATLAGTLASAGSITAVGEAKLFYLNGDCKMEGDNTVVTTGSGTCNGKFYGCTGGYFNFENDRFTANTDKATGCLVHDPSVKSDRFRGSQYTTWTIQCGGCR